MSQETPAKFVRQRAPHPGTRQIDNRRGLILMAIGMALFSLVDAHAKFLTSTMHPLQIVWTRQLGLLAGAVVLLVIHRSSLFRTRHPFRQAARGAAAAGSATLFVIAVAYVPLADAAAVSFVAPFIVTVLGAVLLGEPVGIRRWVAVLLGFVGTLIVLRPGLGTVHPAALLVVLAAALFAVRQILSRFLGAADRTGTTVAYTAFFGSAILTIPLPFVWENPQSAQQIALLVSMATLAGIAEVCVIKALEHALAVVVAPVHYTLIIWSTLYGVLVFGQFPDTWTLVGTTIIVVTGLYMINRERQKMRA